MSKETVYLIVGKYMSQAYIDFVASAFETTEVVKFDDIMEGRVGMPRNNMVAVYSGGADVNPDLYAEKLGKKTSIDKNRDGYEQYMYDFLRRYGVLSVGICRGAQFLTVMSGGSLIQHVEGHGTPHEIEIPMLGKRVIATSTHHQMMYPFELAEKQYDLVAWSRYYQSNTYLNGRDEEISLAETFLEPEIVFYRNTDSLAIQGHPEFDTAIDDYKTACRSLIKYFYENRNNQRR